MTVDSTTYLDVVPPIVDKIAKTVVDNVNAEIEKPTALLAFEKDLKTVIKFVDKILTAIEEGIYTKSTKEKLLSLEATQEDLEAKIAVEKAKQINPLELVDVRTFLNYYARKQYENGQEKNEFMSSFINRVFLFDDKVIILYNTNKRETKKLNKKECLEIINGKNLEEIKENSFEPKKFKRVSSGCTSANLIELFSYRWSVGVILSL